MIEPTPLYEVDNPTQIKIRFRLGASALVVACGYDLDQALQRLSILRGNRVDDVETQGVFDSFTNEVRSLCVMEEIRRTES